MSSRYEARTPLGRAINEIEESLIALFLGLMTVVTFANVVARYVFNSNLLWALEMTVFLFAWLVLFGMSHCLKITAHLGVDALVNMFSAPVRRALAFLAVALSLAYALLLLKGSWDYWFKFATQMSFFEVNDIPFPDAIQLALGITQDGEPRYEYIPRYIPYVILPIGVALLVLRLIEAGWELAKGERTMLIASHEAEDSVGSTSGRES